MECGGKAVRPPRRFFLGGWNRAEEGGCSKVSADMLGVPGLTLLGSKVQEAGEGISKIEELVKSLA